MRIANKKKILWLSDSPSTTTGFANMTRKVLNGLSEDYECHCLAHNYYGRTIVPPVNFKDDDGGDIQFYLHGTGKAKYSMDMIKHIIDKEEIDIFGGLLDTFMLFEAGFMTIDTSPAKTFFYYPSDGGGGLPLNCEQVLKKVQLPIAMAKFGRDQVKKAHDVDSLYIPHGYDKDVFYPMKKDEKEELRKQWGLTGKFVVGSVFRNQGRKMPDRIIKAFKLFCKDKPDAKLLLHTDPLDQAQVFNMNKLINDYKLNNRIVFTGTSFHNPLSHDQMREVYNLMDVFFLSTSGEGFGVPTVEAMACGIPQVVTDYTTTKELVEDDIKTGEAVKLAGETDPCPYPHTNEVLDGTLTGSWNVERGIMSIYDAVKVLTKLYNDRDLLKTYSDNSIIKAKKYYSWDVIIPQFKEAMKLLLEK